MHRTSLQGFASTQGALGTLALFVAALAPSAQTVTLEASKDNVLIEDPTGSLSNGAGPALFAGRVRSTGGGLIRRSVLAFDLSSIPAGATITSASLQMTVNLVPTVGTPYDFDLYAMSVDWGEGTSFTSGGIGAASTTNDATWLHSFFPGTFWTTPGGDFAATSSAQIAITDSGNYVWNTAQMAADVQGWLDAPATNFGWILVGDETAITTAKRFASREDPDPLVRPQLTVTYVPGCGTTAAVATRNAGTNPSTYTAGVMVLGDPWVATVDNAAAGQVLSSLFAFDSPFTLTLGGGQTLLCLDLGGSGELFSGGGLPPTSSAGGIDTYSVTVPNDPGLCGFTICTQAVQIGVPPFTLSNAQDLTLGG